jgi:hypothetical protein
MPDTETKQTENVRGISEQFGCGGWGQPTRSPIGWWGRGYQR